ncbi:hypothetical protein HN51_069590 [Arachis hypogaea]
MRNPSNQSPQNKPTPVNTIDIPNPPINPIPPTNPTPPTKSESLTNPKPPSQEKPLANSNDQSQAKPPNNQKPKPPTNPKPKPPTNQKPKPPTNSKLKPPTKPILPKMLWINDDEGHQVVRCSSNEALHRANSLVNIEFSWFIILVTVFAVSMYLGLVKLYGEKVQYFSLGFDVEDQESNDDVESKKKSFVHAAKAFSSGAHDMGR